MDDLRKERKLNNLCVQCGIILDREGIYCTRCNTMNNISKTQYTKNLHAEGKCADCTNPLDREGWFCRTCITKSNARARERNAQRRLNGECVQCGIKTNLGSYCQRCLDMRMDRYRRKKGIINLLMKR